MLSYLEDTPADATHGFAKGENRQRGRKDGDEDGNQQPSHKSNHCVAVTKSVLGISIDQQTSKLANHGRVAEAGLPGCGDEFFARRRVDSTKPFLELSLAVKGRNLMEFGYVSASVLNKF